MNLEGSILLIHGSAPFNEDGNVPDARAGKYQKTNFYLDLAHSLESAGWKVVRYSKAGVSNEQVHFQEYAKTDLSSIQGQLLSLWRLLPVDRPRVVFAWSEGSLHVHLLPMKEMDGVVILGGISTNLRNVLLSRTEDKAEKARLESELEKISRLPRETMVGLDRPAGRLIDEFNLMENWSYFSAFPALPMLILHGETDLEVPATEAQVWKKKLPSHSVQVQIRPNGNHMYGPESKTGAAEIAHEILKWWKQAQPCRTRTDSGVCGPF